MAEGTQGSQEAPSPDGWAPWGTRRRMRIMAFVGPLMATVLLALGIYSLLTGRHNGPSLTVIGGILAVVWIVAIPLSRRRGKI